MATYSPSIPDKNRGAGFWLRPGNLWAARRKYFRRDRSNLWRYANEVSVGASVGDRRGDVRALLGHEVLGAFRVLVLGDTGEGDRSQYALLPAIRALKADLLIINGDSAYPAGNAADYEAGFFKPYAGLGIPIWATPGNHEYYSDLKGREFLEVFASAMRRSRWLSAGLRWYPQPGYYWMLDHDESPAALIGLDSGQAGCLDGDGADNPEDSSQHQWLEQQLAALDARGRKAIVLFHIPSLVDNGLAKEPRLLRLHGVLARHASVRLVLTGHIHNLQVYDASTWRRFLEDGLHCSVDPGARAAYIVNGGGGAYLNRPPVGGQFRNILEFPNRADWTEHVNLASRALNAVGLAKSLPERVAGVVDEALMSDDDSGRYLSLLVLDFEPDAGSVKVTPICLQSIAALVAGRPPGFLDPADPRFILSATELAGCTRSDASIDL